MKNTKSNLKLFGFKYRKLKNTGIQIIDGDRGKNYPKRNEFTPSGYCIFLNTGNIKNDYFDFTKCEFISEERDSILGKGKLKRFDVILTTRGTVGSVAYFNENVSFENLRINSGMVIIRSSNEFDSNFLYQLFKSPILKKQYYLYSSGAAQPQLPIKDLEKIFIPILPNTTQQKIAAILSAYDDLIENNNRRIAILEEMAQQIYKEWFVRMRFPGWESAEFRKGIPVGWEIRKVGQILELSYGKSLPENNRKMGSYPVYGSSGIVDYHAKYLVEPPGIIVGRKGNVGSIYYSSKPFFPIDTVYFVKSNFSFCFLYYNLQYQNLINADAAVPGLNRNQAYSNKILIPPAKLLERFDKTVSLFFNQFEILKEKNTNLRKTRDLLLPRLMSGKLSVEKIEKQTNNMR